MPRSSVASESGAMQRSELSFADRLSQFRHGLSRAEWVRLGAMATAVIGLNVIGWVTIGAVVAPHHYDVGTKTFGLGVGVTAYTLGMRHAFDADHIAAIDNTTRKLMDDGQRPLSVGFWFSLGHSSVVFALAVALSLGVKSLVGPVQERSSDLRRDTGLIGSAVSGSFLVVIALINVVILAGILRVFRELRTGSYDEETLEAHLDNRGLINRILRPVVKSISRPGQMYLVGLLFGLGFDTATEVGLLVLASAGAAGGLPWYAILSLPLLFAAGMCLFDTIDGTFMNFAYGWAFSTPVRKVFYNLTVTSLSIIVAVFIGGLEVLQVMSGPLNLTGGAWDYANSFDLNKAGFVIVGLFVLTWATALSVWRFAHIEERWSTPVGAEGIEPPTTAL